MSKRTLRLQQPPPPNTGRPIPRPGQRPSGVSDALDERLRQPVSPYHLLGVKEARIAQLEAALDLAITELTAARDKIATMEGNATS